MAFTTKEFPGRVFSSLEEYNTFKEERDVLKKQLFLGATKVDKVEHAGSRENKEASNLEKE